jgi:hypothetical protein
MKKSYVILSAFALLIISAAVLPAYGNIESVNWIAPLVQNHDSFYGETVTGYQAGSTAEFVIGVRNTLYSVNMNVSSIKIWFDWGTNYTDNNPTYNASSPQAIGENLLHVFTVSFDLPDNTIASNLVTHDYVIYVEDVNASGSVIHYYSWFGSNFAVFSSAQADAWNLLKQMDQYDFHPTFLTSQAKQQLLQAQIALNLGDTAYGDGDFNGAVSYYTNASGLIQSAYSSEYDKSLQFENALLGMAQGAVNMLNMMGIGYTLFGIGFFFMGIGVLVYLVRKSGSQRQQQAPPQ